MYKFLFPVLLAAIPTIAQGQMADLHTAAGCGSTKTQFE
jgi:hypothetical protein